ncbi:GNAT family N-acetyltransferase [Marinicella meishanensis]|uniref:GNAT family N-acetyltransferase n=1 Tax=Marinicella meishanensis TaxID=2873263 RepID=UPI001CBC1CA3|nr:GNAT family N-acetyltransferase [Marinicella sp. NBU2979]
MHIQFRPAEAQDADQIESIRAAAFAPVFASFKHILGDDIYRLAQEQEDMAQADELAAMWHSDSPWRLLAVEANQQLVGFTAYQWDAACQVGEIGLNAVDPTMAGQGIGTKMYQEVLQLMRQAGVQVATVATGGDPSHAPARKAYENAGFDVSIPSVWYCQKL